MSYSLQCLQLIEPEFGVGAGRWSCSVQSISSSSPSHRSLSIKAQSGEKTRQRVCIDLFPPIVAAYTGAEQEIKNS